ncbi:MAG: glycosyl hydrolase [Gemmatimonadota bacterium]
MSTFGDVAIAPSDPSVVYAGTGEQNNRQSTSWGNGVYRSDDGGDTWRHLGLEETRHIGKVEVDPRNADVVYVAALGNLWAPSQERGVFRSRDGGATWDKVLFVDENTGAVDLVMNPDDPDVLYAATYQRLRRAWGFNGGGPGSGIYRSMDGGESWTELTTGIPAEDKGRIGLAIAASNPSVLNALIETGDESTQGPDRVYVLATTSFRSEDGGRSWTEIAERPTYDVGVHADQHALWIDPSDPEHLYMGGDAGVHESYDMGTSWRKVNNFQISQFYAIGLDMAEPYNVHGGLQDNHSFMGPSETRRWAGIVNDDWQQTGFGDGMYWQPNPFDPTQAYGTSNDGNYFRLDTRTGDMVDISPVPPEGEEYRFDWTSPALASRHDANTVYVAGNRLFISRDRGDSWTRTEDLSRRIDRDTVPLMGVPGGDITISRNDGTGSFGEATTLAESPLDPSVLWVGMDDGNLQVSRDGGTTWTEVSGNVPGLPHGTYVSRVVASARGAGTAYATFDAHRDGDFGPYVYRTPDFGASWTPLHQGLPDGSVNVVVEHPDNPDVLFLGTEHAAFASTDAGATWAKMPNLPTTAYDDLAIHPREKDLVFGTHGRGIWILDDTRPLAEWIGSVVATPAHLFTIPSRPLALYWKDTSYRGNAEFAGENPPDGVEITYRLGPGGGDALLAVANERGEVVRELRVPSTAGTHRVNWDLRWGLGDGPEAWERFDDERLARPVDDRGPFVSPGRYTISLEARGTTATRTMEVEPDPLSDLTARDYRAREEFMVGLLALQSEIDRRLESAGRDDAEALRRHRRTVGQVYRGMNGGGVRQGSLHPPTETQRRQIEAVRSALR